ncbi:type II toxin-antitoxin system HicB family antitoxin [Kitasatospora sp. NBC_00240]|uniref:type II toxin-antitoxin system HicB family antitoxin n=1 Tax=Kitasatospora sp. NBC_00240 TaxID=2903567 RepID=UPI00225A35CA|nr:type II toxin-antitoxin system HicB family antitoxin [Kitasatospora sp. NBC_00240]MCX5215610.1 type II toxin-antitoxin system HicB family antitoxin [Kitasatospora sp. NBC_00240]
MTTTYQATARRSGTWWAVEVPDVPGAHTQGRNLKEAEQMAREAVALLLDVEEDQVLIDLRPELPRATTDILADFQARRTAREDAEAAERTAQEAAARALKAAGLSVRDAGAVLGISHQRIAQLAPETRPASPGKTRKTVTAATKSKTHANETPGSGRSVTGGRATAGTKTARTKAGARRKPQDA